MATLGPLQSSPAEALGSGFPRVRRGRRARAQRWNPRGFTVRPAYATPSNEVSKRGEVVRSPRLLRTSKVASRATSAAGMSAVSRRRGGR